MKTLWKFAAIVPAAALAACGGGAETAEAEGSFTDAAATSDRYERIGAIEATIDGESKTYPVLFDRERDRAYVDEKTMSGIRSATITGTDIDEDGGPTTPYVMVYGQFGGALGMSSVTILDGSLDHQLESMGMGNAVVTFDKDGSDGTYSGRFEGTLKRSDADAMDGSEQVTFGNSVEVSGTFDVTMPNE